MMTDQAITQQIVDYFKTQPVVKAWIFGSYARGEQTENSDIDILIQPEQSVGLFKMHSGTDPIVHLPQHGIRLVSISFSDFEYDGRKRIVRDRQRDITIVKKKLGL